MWIHYFCFSIIPRFIYFGINKPPPCTFDTYITCVGTPPITMFVFAEGDNTYLFLPIIKFSKNTINIHSTFRITQFD